MLRYALEVNGPVDSLAVTHLDLLPHLANWKVGIRYTLGDDPYRLIPGRYDSGMEGDKLFTEEVAHLSIVTKEFPFTEIPDVIETGLGIPISIKSYGPAFKDKKFVV
jgi:adenylosuccinate synthase